MDINQFLIENTSAVMAIIGAVIGGIITSVPFIVFQIMQRKWQIQDEKRQWRRSRLLNRLSPIQDWLDKTLRFTQAFTQWFNDDTNEKQPSIFVDFTEDDLHQHFQEHLRDEAIVLSHAVSTGDDELLSLIKGFKGLRTNYIQALSANDKIKIEANKVALEAIASKTARRIEFLLEQAQPIGGNYHVQPVFRFFRKRVRSQKPSA
jgi:hypothetical protein